VSAPPDSSGSGQAVILCGGRGTRLAGAVGDLPKVLVPIAGRPHLAWLLEGLAAAGTREVLLVAGFGGERVAEAARALAPAGLRVETRIEPAALGTAGALHVARDALRERFLLLFGDVFAHVDWARLASHADGLATLLLHRSSHPEDSDVARVDDAGRVVGWARGGPRGSLGNAAVAAVSRELLRFVPRDRATDLYRDVFPSLVDARAAIAGYVSSEYVHDFGTPARLAAVEADVAAGKHRLRAELALVDRDGVIIDESGGPPVRAESVQLIPRAAEGLRALRAAGVRLALVTNQAAIARGLASEGDVAAVHARVEDLAGVRFDGIYVCPHHPEAHHADGVAALRGPCACRKPRTGLAERAIAELGADPGRVVVIGDATTDLQLARNAGLASVAVETGKGAKDGACPATPTWRFADLEAAARWIAGG